MPSMRCHQCTEVRTCRMHVTDTCRGNAGRPCGMRAAEHADTAVDHAYKPGTVYLCAGCARELGYVERAP